MQMRHVTPHDFVALSAFDCHPLPSLRSGELRLFTQWWGALSFVVETPVHEITAFALAMGNADRTTVFLHYLVVAESLRGHGWGARLLHAVETAAVAHGAQHMALWTGRAGAYYTARGYAATPALVPREPDAYNAAHRGAQFFVKPLVPSGTPEEARPW